VACSDGGVLGNGGGTACGSGTHRENEVEEEKSDMPITPLFGYKLDRRLRLVTVPAMTNERRWTSDSFFRFQTQRCKTDAHARVLPHQEENPLKDVKQTHTHVSFLIKKKTQSTAEHLLTKKKKAVCQVLSFLRHNKFITELKR
jgi:hypothetical protein